MNIHEGAAWRSNKCSRGLFTNYVLLFRDCLKSSTKPGLKCFDFCSPMYLKWQQTKENFHLDNIHWKNILFYRYWVGWYFMFVFKLRFFKENFVLLVSEHCFWEYILRLLSFLSLLTTTVSCTEISHNLAFYQLCHSSLAIPALSLAIPALSLAIPALSLAIPALSLAIPALLLAILALSWLSLLYLCITLCLPHLEKKILLPPSVVYVWSWLRLALLMYLASLEYGFKPFHVYKTSFLNI